MGNILILGMVVCGVLLVWTWLYDAKAKVVPVPSDARLPQPMVTPVTAGKPRWHKFDTLLEVQENLRASGVDEKEVLEICANIAVKLLGGKHE